MTESTSTAASHAPLLFFNRQPISPEAAAAQRAELLADPKFCDEARAGNIEKAKMLADLWQLERGRQPGAPAPQDAADVQARMTERELQIEQQRSALRKNLVAPETPEEEFQFERGEATKLNKQTASRRIEAAKKDPAFRNRLLSGDKNATRDWNRWHFVRDVCKEVEA
jgi:hypothetical protein